MPRPVANSGSVEPSRRKREPEIQTGNGFTARATRLLRTELKNGPRPQAELVELAEGDDISPAQLIKVAERLNIRTQKGWWRLPG